MIINPHQKLKNAIIKITGEDSNYYIEHIPKRWERFSDVILFNEGSFTGEKWDSYVKKEFWEIIAEALDVKRIGIKGEIFGDKRESNVRMVLGEMDWVIRLENGIKYGYNITQCMFSAGNINERRRMGKIVTSGEIIVDLYAGIGYYTLPILANSLTKHVFACEWNENAISALRRNLQINNIDETRYSIFEGDNRITTNQISGVADRVILGLLPSSFDGFSPALRVLKDSGGILHIHGLGMTKNHEKWASEIEERLKFNNYKINRIGLIKIKSHSPHWDHLVLDLKLEKK